MNTYETERAQGNIIFPKSLLLVPDRPGVMDLSRTGSLAVARNLFYRKEKARNGKFVLYPRDVAFANITDQNRHNLPVPQSPISEIYELPLIYVDSLGSAKTKFADLLGRFEQAIFKTPGRETPFLLTLVSQDDPHKFESQDFYLPAWQEIMSKLDETQRDYLLDLRTKFTKRA